MLLVPPTATHESFTLTDAQVERILLALASEDDPMPLDELLEDVSDLSRLADRAD